MNTETQNAKTMNDYERFLAACENAAGDIDNIVGNMGLDDFAHNGPGQIRFYARLWREEGKPTDSQLGTASLERGLEYSKMLLKMIGLDDGLWMDRLDSLKQQAREFKKNMA